jgi:hypothetical protein
MALVMALVMAVAGVWVGGCQAPPSTVTVARVVSSFPANGDPSSTVNPLEADGSGGDGGSTRASTAGVSDAESVVLSIQTSSGSDLKTMVIKRDGRVTITSATNVTWSGVISPARIEAYRQLLVREQACAHGKRVDGLAVVEATANFPSLRCTGHWADVGPMTEPTFLHFHTVWKATEELVNDACQGKCPDFSEGVP